MQIMVKKQRKVQQKALQKHSKATFIDVNRALGFVYYALEAVWAINSVPKAQSTQNIQEGMVQTP